MQDYIAIDFSPNIALEKFRTKVNDTVLPDNIGFEPDEPDGRRYLLKVQDILGSTSNLPENASRTIEICFHQGEISHKTMDMSLVELSINSSLKPTCLKVTFKLPKIVGILSNLNYHLNVLIKRKRDRYEIEPYPLSDFKPAEIDKKNGLVVFNAANEIKGTIRFSYRPLAKVDWPSLFLGLFFGILGGIIVELIVRVILPLIGVKNN